MVVVEILGVVKDVTPDPPVKGEPPVETEYQSIVAPEGALAFNVNVPFPHLAKLLDEVGAIGRGFMVTTVAVLVEEHALAFVTSTV